MLAGSMLRDTANESRYDDLRQYDGSRRHDVGLLSSRYVLADEIPRMNRGMTICGGMTVRGGMT
ncbi:hypothetical protein NMD99_07080 [Wolbachia endosymbiont of Listronotus oregonensis]|uniref:hypothetical protein n=1 Tax=Wolbachia endosymbiont of Listronotus oregonensis TaxID=2969106 RepID=UPI002815BF63|nr:hypothetical protein [Wolbachia endosymbiont of Listronotus oregonensis]WMT84349.1 hypothetical protein NMD99_07080 [Wolbachia endosymbiont of Listronotus oregonensis]